MTSDDVIQSFYNRHPYPPPLTNLDKVAESWASEERRRAEHHLFWPSKPFVEEFELLVAGCGTSQAASYALRYPRARVVGIDISTTSLHHSQQLKERYQLSNLSLEQLRVEEAAELGRRFDKIVCTGVLHHLPDPDAGLAALRDTLQSDGAMHLMLYAPYGRTGITMLQEYARRLGIGTSEREIDDFATALVALPEGHPLEQLLRSSPDFRRKEALADALLNPRERAYSVPQLYDYLARNGMAFGRWLRQAPYLAQCGLLAATPHATRLAALPANEEHAAVELFRGTMVRHSVIAYRADSPNPQPTIVEDTRRPKPGVPVQSGPDEAWGKWVPLRLPQTRCIVERLPSGAAAVLLNQSHSYPDLYLAIDREEKRIYDSINSQRTINDILNAAAIKGTEHRQRARSFFARLWNYDQIVFDASQL